MSRQHKDAYFFCFAQNYAVESINQKSFTGQQ